MLISTRFLRAVCISVCSSVCKKERKVDGGSMHVNVFTGFFSSPYRLKVIWVMSKVKKRKVQQSKHGQLFPSILSRSEMRGRTELER